MRNSIDILKFFSPKLPGEDADGREWAYLDALTGRSFEIRELERLGAAGQTCLEYFVYELEPSGRMFDLDGKGKATRWRDEPRIKEIEARVGPNGFAKAAADEGLSLDAMVHGGSGLSRNSRYFPSLGDCAQAIGEALDGNVRFDSTRELSGQEKVRNARADARDTAAFWRSEANALARASGLEKGIFKGCYNMMGHPLGEEYKKAILAYLNAPTQAGWLEIRGFCVVGATTLWQAWGAIDCAAPRSGDVGFPDAEVLREAIRRAVAAREARIKEEVKGASPSGLQVVGSGKRSKGPQL